MNRWPIRIRLTAAFTLAMALVLSVVAVVTVLSTRASLDESIASGLEYRLRGLEAVAAADAPVLPQAGKDTASQILSPGGQVLASTPETRGQPLLGASEVPVGGHDPTVVERQGIGSLPGPVRVAAIAAPDGRFLVAAVSLADRDAAVGDLSGELAVSFPLVLVVAAAGAYLLAAGVLRPVERMRARAAAITADDPDQLLPVPPARDEISRLGATFNELINRLHASLDRQRRFVADASHDLRTPLSLLTTELELALRRPRSAEELVAALRSALEETERLSRLADSLLLLSSADQAPRAASATELGRALEAVAARYLALAGKEGLRVQCPVGLMAQINRDDLERAVGNLVDNALVHGKPPITIVGRTAAESQGRAMVAVEVRDSGAGIDPGFLPHIFDRFTRADSARSVGGAGLGLAITSALAHRNRGQAVAGNHPGGGAVLTLLLPAADAPVLPAGRP